jgi:endonuclease/exonuclease/phosphatase family metal-dependent hydrolase
VRRLLSRITALCCLSLGLTLAAPFPARAADADPMADHLAKSSISPFTLRNVATGKYVTTEVNGESGRWALLRARGDSAGSWEKFVRLSDDNGATWSVRSIASGRYVTAEIGDSGTDKGRLRARGHNTGSWEKFRFVRRQVGADVYFAVQSVANGLYVSAENNFTGANAGMLRARTPADQIGSWELFTMGFPEPYPGQGEPEAPSPTPRRQAQVMSWNVCANNNSACGDYRDDGDAVATALAQHLNATLGSAYHPDVLLLQEICERHTRTIESSLESRTGRGWDVRFAPIKVESEYPDLTLEKRCRDDQSGNDRGLYGVAVAVPEENTKYFSRELRATWGTVSEQRVALCAYVPSHAAAYCSAHLSTPGEDPSGETRRDQVNALLRIAGDIEKDGYAPVIGGDLNTTPATGGILDPLYTKFQECWSAPGTTGTGATYGTAKLDYIFARGHTSCTVSSDNAHSDHRSLHSTVTLP